MKFASLSPADIPDLAHFLATAQSKSETHMGYVPSNEADIATDLADLELSQFFIARDESGICAFLGADIDNDARAWVYGSVGEIAVVMQLWHLLEPKLVDSKAWLLFADAKNAGVATFASQIGCVVHGQEHVLELTKQQWVPQLTTARVATEQDAAAFIALHDQIFANTYYDGAEILERLSEYHVLFVLEQNNTLLGYSYAEVGEYGTASLEFIGVQPSARGQGIGRQLMSKTLEWIFTFANVESVFLTVNSTNLEAITMYQRLGFVLQRQMVSYRKTVNV